MESRDLDSFLTKVDCSTGLRPRASGVSVSESLSISRDRVSYLRPGVTDPGCKKQKNKKTPALWPMGLST